MNRKGRPSVNEAAMGHRYAYERHDRLDDDKPAYPITDLRTDGVIAILVDTTDRDAALIVRALNEANR